MQKTKQPAHCNSEMLRSLVEHDCQHILRSGTNQQDSSKQNVKGRLAKFAGISVGVAMWKENLSRFAISETPEVATKALV